jgi:hypothetical protein
MSYSQIIGAMDELDALDAMSGGDIAIGADEEDFLELMAASGYDEIIGQDAPAAPTSRGTMAKARALAARMKIARQIDPRAVVVEDRPSDQRREFPLGFVVDGPTGPGLSGAATANPQVTFRSERLIVPSFIAPFFVIDNIIVGKDSQQVSANPLPASTFTEVAVGVRLNLKTAMIGNIISLLFTNVDVAERLFQATIIGTAVE